MVIIPKLTHIDADDIETCAQNIMRIDGDRDHMSKSDMICEQTQAIARFLYAIARELRAGQPPAP